jgi:hypothetical protein
MSPLELFRRNQKVMMTFLILLAMFAFVVLPTVSQYLQRSGPGMSDPTVAQFNGVSLTAGRVSGFTQKHYATVQFLKKLANETMRRKGTPKVPGFAFDQSTGQIQSVGINGAPNEETSIRTLQFAAEAEEQGFELDDTALEGWMEQFTDGTMSDREIYALLRQQTNNQMGKFQLFDMLRKQLLSALYFRGASATVARGQFPLQSPLDHWKNFLKLNQKATIDAYGLLVNDYVAQTDANPSQADILAVYEKGKDRYPSEQSPDPGFRRRDTASFEYLMAELQEFRDAEVAKLTEDEIKAEYERRISGGAFQLPPDAVIEEDLTIETEATAEPNETMKSAPESDAPSTPESDAPSDSKDTPKADPKNVQADQQKQVEDFAKELEEGGKLDPVSTETPSDGDQSSAADSPNGVRLVAMQSDVSTEAADAVEATDSVPPTDVQVEMTETVETAEPRYRPFEEVRDQVAQSMVENKARLALDQAVTTARSAMKKYSRERAIYETSGDTKKPAPQRPDLKALAQSLGLTYRAIGPHNPVSLADEPIANSFEEGTALSERGVPFTAFMFGVEGQVIKQDVFSPVASVDLEAQRTYLTWKTEEKAAYSPELDEVRGEVIDAIRVAQARELARQAAEVLADKANGSANLEELIPEDRKDNYFVDVGPFSWLNMVGFGSVTIGNVPELDSVDDEFMKAVFKSPGGEHVVAPNGPQRVFYVIRRTSLLPATADLRAIFSQQSERIMAMFMTDGTAAKVQEGFFDAVDEKTGFVRMELPQ